MKDFSRLSQEQKDDILDYLNEFELYAEVCAGGKHYILAHAGLGNFSPEKRLEDYSLEELAFSRTDYSKALFQDKILVTGHTPTSLKTRNLVTYTEGIIILPLIVVVALAGGSEQFVWIQGKNSMWSKML